LEKIGTDEDSDDEFEEEEEDEESQPKKRNSFSNFISLKYFSSRS